MGQTIIQKALSKSLEERELINATVDGLVRKLAQQKAVQVKEFIENMERSETKNFCMKLAKVECELSSWGDTAFYIKASFIRRDLDIKAPLTKKEASVFRKYQELVKDVRRWWSTEELTPLLEQARSLNADIFMLKNGISLTKEYIWKYSFESVLNSNFLTRGVNFNRE